MIGMIEWIVSSAALLAVLIVLRQMLKGKISLRLQYALWGLALLRLLVPVSFGSTAVSVQNALPSEARAIPETVTFRREIENSTNPLVYLHTINTPIQYAIYEEQTQTGVSEADVTVVELRVNHWREILMVLWLIGMAAVALCLFGSNLRFALRLRKTRKLLREETLPVYLTEEADTPCLFGLFRPAIYVTPEAAEEEGRLRHVIEHELTHYRHADHLWSLLRGICLVLHWYNPLVWWAAILSRRDCELACDEATIRRLGEGERSAYGRTLIYMTCAKRPALLLTATTMTGGKGSIKERIRLIARKPRTVIAALVALLLIVAAAVGCTFTGGKEKEPDPTEAPATAAPSATPTALSEDATLYDRFFAEADPNDLTWALGDYSDGRILRGAWSQSPFRLPPVEGLSWRETDPSELKTDINTPGIFRWTLTLRDETRNASVTFVDPTFMSENLVICTEGDQKRFFTCPLGEDMGPYAAYPNDAGTQARRAVLGEREVPRAFIFLPTNSTDPEAVAKDYAGAYVGQFIEALQGNPYKAYDATVETRVMEVRKDGNAFIFQAYLGFSPAEPDRFAGVIGAGSGGWNEEKQRFYVWRYFCLEKTEGGWTGVDLDVLNWYSEYAAVYGEYFASVPNPKADEAIHRAVMDFNRGNYKSGEAACESHVLVAEESEPGSAGTTVETYYLMILYQEYDWVDGAPKVVGGSYIPSALSFEVSPEGEYTLLEYWTPRDGSLYWDDLRARFPADVPDEDLDTQNPKYVERVHASCDAQARAYFAAEKEPAREDRPRVQLWLDLGEQTVPEPVAQYALEVAQQELDYYELSCGYVFDDARITAITYIGTGTVGLWDGYNLYRLEWRFRPAEGEEILPVGGMTMEDGCITERGSAGQPYVLVGWKQHNGYETWERICVTNTDEIETEYGTPEMIEKYGNAYTAAAVELRAKARKQQSLLDPRGFSVASSASDPALIGQDWAKAFAARFTQAPEDEAYYCRSMEVRRCEVYAESLLNEPKQYVYVMSFACDPADADSFCSQLAGWGQDTEHPDWLRFDWFVVLEDDLKGGWKCAQAGSGGYGGWGYLNHGWNADELLDRIVTEQVSGEDTLMLLPLIDWHEFDRQYQFDSDTWDVLWRKLYEACVGEGRIYDAQRSLQWSDVYFYDQLYRDMYVILGFLHADAAYSESLATILSRQYAYDPIGFEQSLSFFPEERQREIRMTLEATPFSQVYGYWMEFFDLAGQPITNEDGWYHLTASSMIRLTWTGEAPEGIRLLYAPAGTEAYDQTRLLIQRSLREEDRKRGEVSFMVSELDGLDGYGHLYGELDNGWAFRRGGDYNVLYEPEVDSVTLSRTDITLMRIGESYTLRLTVSPEGIRANIRWISQDPKVATVDENGTVTAVGPGTTEIIASVGGFGATCTVRVPATATGQNEEEQQRNDDSQQSEKKIRTLILPVEIILTGRGETYSIQPGITPWDSGEKIRWTSSDPAVATVDENGTVTAVSDGKAVIRAAAERVWAECTVRVEQLESKGSGSVIAALHIYDGPTLEKTEPKSLRRVILDGSDPDEADAINEIKSIIDGIRFWTNDEMVDRVEFYFDGDIVFSDREFVYYFSYDKRIIFYDRYFAGISEKDMEYIRSIAGE